VGYANDTSGHRALNGSATMNVAMTSAMCQTCCLSKNYPLADVEYGKECYCGLGLAFGSIISQTGCSMACAGDASEFCGGPSMFNVSNYIN
jgi:hypothetical protein